MKIFKYVLRPDIPVEMPKDAQILSVKNQYGEIVVYAVVNPDNVKVKRKFDVIGTGWDISDTNGYIGTVMLQQGTLVFHIFDRGEINV